MGNFFKISSIVSLISIFWIFWLPGPKVATDYHLTTKEIQLDNLFPWIWRETNVADGLGEYTGITLWSQPVHFFFGFLYQLSLPFSFLTKLLVLVILLLSFISMFKLVEYLKTQDPYKGVSSLFYVLNTFFLLLVDGGQLALALAYSVFPLSVYFFLRLFEKVNFRNRLFFTLNSLAISIFDIRIVYLLFIVCFLYVLFKIFLSDSKREFILISKEVLFSAILAPLVIFSFHSYWLLPALLIRMPQLPQSYDRVSQIDFLSFSTLLHSLTLSQPHWYKNIFGKISEVSFEFLLIPATAFAALVLVRRNFHVAFWSIIAILGIFLSKGSNPPLTQIYLFLFTNIPGFSVFRDPAKFYFLTCLSYSVLIGFSLQAIGRFIKIAPLIFIIYLIFLVRPVYLGQMNGLFSFPSFQREYNQLSDFLDKDESFSRVFWIPNTAPLGFVNTLHPAVPADRFSQRRPFAAGTKGTYETFNFLREASYMGEIFDVLGIGYIVYPYIDSKREGVDFDKEKYYYTFLNQLLKLPWLSRVEYSGIPALKVKNHQDKFFSTKNIWWVVGDDDLYNESTKSAELKLSDNGLIFVEEYAGLGQRIDETPDAKIVLNKKSTTDLAASFIDQSKLIFPAESLGFDPDKSGWWKREAVDLVWWRDFLQGKYGIDNKDFDLGGGWAVGEGKKKYQISNIKYQKGDMLLARVMESSRSGQLKFSQGSQTIGKIETRKENTNVRWFEIGQLVSSDNLLINSEGDINVVNALAILDKNEWINYQDKAKSLEGRIVNFDGKNAQNDNNPTVTYRKINPTRYVVNISGLTHPMLLVFSQNYDTLWKLNDQTSLPVYSLLNGFKVNKDGQYTVEFSAQKYVLPGLIISGLTLTALVLLLFPYIITTCSNLLSKLPHLDSHR